MLRNATSNLGDFGHAMTPGFLRKGQPAPRHSSVSAAFPPGRSRTSSVALRQEFELGEDWSSPNGNKGNQARVSASHVSAAKKARGLTSEDSAADSVTSAELGNFDIDDRRTAQSYVSEAVNSEMTKYESDDYEDNEGDNSFETGRLSDNHHQRGPRRHGVRNAKTKAQRGEYVVNPNLEVWRRRAAHLLVMAKFKCAMGAIIMLNMVLVIIDTDNEAAHEPTPPWVEAMSMIFLCIYLFEIVLRFYVYRLKFFLQPMNVFDLYIVISDLVFKILGDLMTDSPSMSVMRVLRCVRIVRVFRSFVIFRELYLMMQGLFSALKAIFWATFLLLVVLSIFGILAVTYLHPLNQKLAETGVYDDCGEPCVDAYKSVTFSILHFIKTIIAGDSWGQVSMPVLVNYPFHGGLILIGVLLITQIGVLNLIVAVIVDKAAEARREDKELQHNEKIENFHQATTDLLQVFQKMDHDNSGSLTLQELLEGFDVEESFAECLQLMDISREDLTMVFYILDKDRSGDIDYKEFVEQLYMMKSQDPHTLLVFIRHITTNLEESLKTFMTKSGEQIKMIEERNAKQDKHLNEVFGDLQKLLGHTRTSEDSFAPEKKEEKSRESRKIEVKPDINGHALDSARSHTDINGHALDSARSLDSTRSSEGTATDLLYGSLEFLRLQVQRDALKLQRQVEKDLSVLSERTVRNTAIVVGQAQRHNSLRSGLRPGTLSATTPRASPSPAASPPGSQRTDRPEAYHSIACFPAVTKKRGYGTLAALLKETSHVLDTLHLPEGDSGFPEKGRSQESFPPVPDVEWGIPIDSSAADMPEAPGPRKHHRPKLAAFDATE